MGGEQDNSDESGDPGLDGWSLRRETPPDMVTEDGAGNVVYSSCGLAPSLVRVAACRYSDF